MEETTIVKISDGFCRQLRTPEIMMMITITMKMMKLMKIVKIPKKNITK